MATKNFDEIIQLRVFGIIQRSLIQIQHVQNYSAVAN